MAQFLLKRYYAQIQIVILAYASILAIPKAMSHDRPHSHSHRPINNNLNTFRLAIEI